MRVLKIIGRVIAVVIGIIVLLLIAAIVFLKYYPGVGKTPDEDMKKEYAERTEFFDGESFKNAGDFQLMTGEKKSRRAKTRPDGNVPVLKLKKVENAGKDQLKVIWLGHSSSLVQLGEKNILIDPVLTEYASPVSFAGPKRFSDIALMPCDVPDIDVLLLSHDHYDHMDRETIMEIDDRVKSYIVPLGAESYLLGWGIDAEKIHSLGWWEEVQLDGISFTSTPAQHFSGRNPMKSNASWWCGYYFKDNSHSVYFTGDTGYNTHFSEIGERFGGADLALVECGQYDKAWADCHMSPDKSVQAASDIGAEWMIPVHWGAFVLANHDWDEPAAVTAEVASKLSVKASFPKIGETVDYDEIGKYTDHWWESVD